VHSQATKQIAALSRQDASMLDKLEDGVYNIKIQNDVAFVTTFKTT